MSVSKGFLFYALARKEAINHNWALAERYYLDALSSNFKPNEVRSRVGMVLYHQGHWREAKEYLGGSVKQNPAPHLKMSLARCCHQLREYAEAESHLLDLMNTRHRETTAAIRLLMKIYRKVDRHEEVPPLVKRLCELEGETVKNRLDLAQAYTEVGKTKEAIKQLKLILAMPSITPEAKKNAIKKIGEALEKSYNSEGAIEVYHYAMSKGLSSAKIISSLGRNSERTKHYQKAIEAYKYGARNFPSLESWFLYRLSVSLLQTGMAEEACEFYKNSFTLSAPVGEPKSNPYSSGYQSEIQGQYTKAIAQYRKASKRASLKELSYFRIGLCLLKQSKPREAAEYFFNSRLDATDIQITRDKSFLSDAPTYPSNLPTTSLITYVTELLEQKCYVLSELYTLMAIDNKPGNARLEKLLLKVRCARGKEYVQQSLWSTAIKYYSSAYLIASQIDGKLDVDSYLGFSVALRRSHNFKKATSVINEALRIYPRSYLIQAEQARLLKDLGDLYNASRVWQAIYRKPVIRQEAKNLVDASSVLMSYYDLEEHERCLSYATKLFGDENVYILYHKFASYFSKVVGTDTEQLIFGRGKYASRYSKSELMEEALRCGYKLLAQRQLPQDKQDRSLRRLTTLELMVAEYHWKAKEIELYLAHTLKAIQLFEDRLPTHLSDSLFNIFQAERAGDTSLRDNLRRSIEKLTPDAMDFTHWLMLSDLLSFNKLLELGLLARESAVRNLSQLTIYGSRASYYTLSRKFYAHIELREFEDAQKIVNMISAYSPEQPRNTALQTFLDIQKAKPLKEPRAEDELHEQASMKMHELIHDKNVAIVGPAANVLSSGSEIDKFDTIIRFNFRGKEFLSHENHSGSRTDITYQNGPNVRAYHAAQRPHFLKDVKLYCVELFLSKALLVDLKQGRARSNGHRNDLLCYKMMAVPTVLYDILHYGPRSIKVFNSNFYLSETPYSEGYTTHHSKNYRKHKGSDISQLHELIRTHDLIAQLRFVRNVYDAGGIEVDAECEGILKLTDRAYMAEMEKLFEY